MVKEEKGTGKEKPNSTVDSVSDKQHVTAFSTSSPPPPAVCFLPRQLLLAMRQESSTSSSSQGFLHLSFNYIMWL